MTDFERLLEALSGAGVEFILVGGVAATVHGSARLTQDIDVVYARAGENLDGLSPRWERMGPISVGHRAVCRSASIRRRSRAV